MRAPTSIALVALAVLLLSGCLPQQSTVTPTPEASSTPVFASDEEALAAATAAYAAYLAMSDQIAADGGANPERLEPFVTADQQASAIAAFGGYVNRGLRADGVSSFDSVTLAQYEESPVGIASVDMYLCLDVSTVRVIDANGANVTPVDRDNRLPLQIGFDSASPNESALLLARSESWTGEDFCLKQ